MSDLGDSNWRIDSKGDLVPRGDRPISPAQLSGAWAGKVLVYDGSNGVSDVIDPAGTATPVGDALAAAPSGGSISLPNGVVQEDSTIVWNDNISLETRGAYNGATIYMPNVTGELMVFNGATNADFDPFRLVGPGDNAAATDALVFKTNQCNKLRFHGVSVRGVYGRVIHTLDAGHYQIDFDTLFWNVVDSGNVSGAIHFDTNAGPSWNFGSIYAYPSATTSAANSTLVWQDPYLDANIGDINVGGSTGTVLAQTGAGIFNVYGSVNYEPDSQQSTPQGVFTLTGGTESMILGPVTVNGAAGAATDHVYRVRAGNSVLGRTQAINAGTVNGAHVEVEQDISDSVVYLGDSADVNNSSGATLTSQVACLGDLATVS